MRVVITHTDLRIYWPSRISALQRALVARGDELYTIEIAGAGSPYAFADASAGGDASAGEGTRIRNWICLFPMTRMEDLPPARASRKLREKLDELNPDVIMSGSIAYPSGAAAVSWAKRHHKAVVMFDDIRPGDVPRNYLVNYIKRLLYGQVDAVLCPAPAWTSAFTYWDFRPEQLFFGVDVVDNDFWGVPSSQPPTRHSSYLLAVGRQIAAKNFLWLLEAYRQYRDRCEMPLSLFIIGDGPEKVKLEEFIREHRLQDVYLLPFADPYLLRSFYQQAAALVLPSLSETWGLVVNEGMAAGLPVFVSRACGCASVLVQEGVNGYTFSPDKPDELLNAFLAFTNKTPTEKAAMGRKSKRIIRPWGLDQFVKGSLLAIDYARANRKICKSIPARLVLQHWKGRYRPV